MQIYCCGCQEEVEARLTNGAEIYPHRQDLASLPFWKCNACGNYVGCHHKTKNRTAPLGVIPTPEIRKLRKLIHAEIDPMWKNGSTNRKARNTLYDAISKEVGWNYHTARIRSAEEAEKVLAVVVQIKSRGGE